MKYQSVSVIGLGYIGLPTAAIFASRKIKVIGVDTNKSAVDIINQGKIHIIEPELDIIVHAAVTEGYLKATTTPEPADAFIIAVPTPFKENKEPDLSYIKSACDAIAPILKKGDLVILESTSPVGATEQMAQWLSENRQDLTFPQTNGANSDIRVAHCPERVLPGKVVRELVENDRIIGGLTPKCSEAAQSLYKVFVEGTCTITDARTAEMAKLTENSFRDVNIAFANELSLICERLNIDVWELISLANRHPRVDILQPGPGVGGHCIAVDPWFIVNSAPEQAHIIKTARIVNDSKPNWVVNKVKTFIANKLNAENKNRKISVAFYGLSFKPNIDDLRESPAAYIVQQLCGLNSIEALIVEPNINLLPQNLIDKAQLTTVEQALSLAEINIILVAHKEFINIKDRFSKCPNTLCFVKL